jgi:hypothetical protein
VPSKDLHPVGVTWRNHARAARLHRFAVVGLAAYGVTLLGDYSLKLTVFREKPVTALFFATASLTAPRLVWSPPTFSA